MVFLINSWMPGMIDALFQATFLCSLLMFWLCIYHGLRQNERKFLTFYLPKLIVVLPIWLCAIVLATWEKCNEMRDPTYSHFVDAGNYNVYLILYFRFAIEFNGQFRYSHFRHSSILPVQCICSIWSF